MKLWLTRQYDGSYMLTLLKPHIVEVNGTEHKDAYIQLGEPIGVRFLCAGGIRSVLGLDEDLEALESIPVVVEMTRRKK